MNKWRVYLTDGTTIVVTSRYYYLGSKLHHHIFDNFPKYSHNEDTVARFNPSSVIGVVKE